MSCMDLGTICVSIWRATSLRFRASWMKAPTNSTGARARNFPRYHRKKRDGRKRDDEREAAVAERKGIVYGRRTANFTRDVRRSLYLSPDKQLLVNLKGLINLSGAKALNWV